VFTRTLSRSGDTFAIRTRKIATAWVICAFMW